MINLSEFLFISSIIKMLVVCVLEKTIHLLQHQDTGCSQISGKKYIQIFAYREFGETHLEFIYSTNPREFVI